jgi:hypothetical protein
MDSVLQDLTQPKKPPTKTEYKKMMGKFFTYRNDHVVACGHKFHQVNEPRNQCPSCWAAFFFTQGETSAIADEVFQKGGNELLIRIKGRVFTKWFLRFMGEIQKKLKEQKSLDSSGEMGMANGGR